MRLRGACEQDKRCLLQNEKITLLNPFISLPPPLHPPMNSSEFLSLSNPEQARKTSESNEEIERLTPPPITWRAPFTPEEICDALRLPPETYHILPEWCGFVTERGTNVIGSYEVRNDEGGRETVEVYEKVQKPIAAKTENGVLLIYTSATLENIGREAVASLGLPKTAIDQAQAELDYRREVARIAHCNQVIAWAWNIRHLKPFKALPAEIKHILERCIQDGHEAEGPNFPSPWSKLWKRACELSPWLERKEILLDFGGRFRIGGWSDQQEYLVIQQDGTLREPDKLRFSGRDKDMGEKMWNLVTPSELALTWTKANTGTPHQFEVAKMPVDDITIEQREAARRFVQTVALRFDGQKSMSGILSPPAGRGWNFEAARARFEADIAEEAERPIVRRPPPVLLPKPKPPTWREEANEPPQPPSPSPEERRALIEREQSPEFIEEIRSSLERIDALLSIIEQSFRVSPISTQDERLFLTKEEAMRRQWSGLCTDLLEKKKGLELREDVRKLHEKILRVSSEKLITQSRSNFSFIVQRKVTEWTAIPDLVKMSSDCAALLDYSVCTETELVQAIQATFLNNPWKQTAQEALAATVDRFLDRVS